MTYGLTEIPPQPLHCKFFSLPPDGAALIAPYLFPNNHHGNGQWHTQLHRRVQRRIHSHGAWRYPGAWPIQLNFARSSN